MIRDSDIDFSPTPAIPTAEGSLPSFTSRPVTASNMDILVSANFRINDYCKDCPLFAKCGPVTGIDEQTVITSSLVVAGKKIGTKGCSIVEGQNDFKLELPVNDIKPRRGQKYVLRPLYIGRIVLLGQPPSRN